MGATTDTNFFNSISASSTMQSKSSMSRSVSWSPIKPTGTFSLPWAEQQSPVSSPSRGPTSPPRPKLWSPAASTRKTQYRALANTHLLKHRWLKDAVMERCQYGSQDTLGSTQRRLRGEIRSTPQKDIFRSTNEFYREGVKRLMERSGTN